MYSQYYIFVSLYSCYCTPTFDFIDFSILYSFYIYFCWPDSFWDNIDDYCYIAKGTVGFLKENSCGEMLRFWLFCKELLVLDYPFLTVYR